MISPIPAILLVHLITLVICAITTDGTFTNNATINPTGDLAITAGYTAINQGSIVSGNLDVITADFFRNLTGGDIAVANLNIIAGGKVTNTANITAGNFDYYSKQRLYQNERYNRFLCIQ